MMENNWQNLISINRDIRFGKPVIAGTRICVSDILSWLSKGMSFEEIIEDFPELKKKHICAALNFSSEI
jgi:uncharacterized protein (DUF433 family)